MKTKTGWKERKEEKEKDELNPEKENKKEA